jgi:hypothetical protein
MFKQIKHQILLKKYCFNRKRETIDLIAEAINGVAARWRGEYQPIYTYIVMFDVLRQKSICGKGLEIGGGYSTILLSEYAKLGSCEIESVDVNPIKYLRIIPSKRSRDFLFQNIKRIDRLSVSFDEVIDAYQNKLVEKIEEIGVSLFLTNLKQFSKDESLFLGDARENALGLGKKMLSMDLLKSEKQFYIEKNLVGGSGYSAELRKMNIQYDFIFFDCGEYSSLAEWFILEDQIKVGGYAFLHDIYYPKSIKNFIVATLIASSKKWEIIYQDKFSAQGGLVARRRE